jgi:trigger factor
MNIAIEEISSLRRRLRIEVPADRVTAAFSKTANEFQKIASIRGFRPGKAPLALVEKRYAKDIEEEVRRRIIPEAFREAVRSKKLDIVHVPAVEDIQEAQPGSTFSFSVVVDLAPDFKLPEYKGIPVKKADVSVTDADVDEVLQRLLDRDAEYKPVERPVQQGDYAIITYTGTCEGQPIETLVPKEPKLGKQEKLWLWIKDDFFLPGFGTQLIGARAGESRTVTVEFPADFALEPLRGKKGVYETQVEEVREKILPALDDAFAQKLGHDSLDELKTRLRSNIEVGKAQSAQDEHLRQLYEYLLSKTEFDLPESSVLNETQRTLMDIVMENQLRGIPDHVLMEHKEEIFNAAESSARKRVKLAFILGKIAEAEKIEVTPAELNQEILDLAKENRMSVEKFLKRLQKNDALDEIEQKILNRKTREFLLQSAAIS